MTQVEITTPAELGALAPEWTALWARCPSATPFQHPGWLLPWWETFGPGRLATIAIYNGNRLAGLAPLYRDPAGIIRFLGAGISDYLDVLLEPELAAAGAAAIYARLDGLPWIFDDVPAGSPLLACPPTGAAREVCAVCPVAELHGAFGAFLARLPRGLRNTLARSRRRLDARFESATPATAGEFLDALFRLHSTRWADRNSPGVLAGQQIRSFHCRAAPELLRRGLARLDGLRFGETLVAVLYGFACRNRISFYLNGFEPALRRFSPGILLLAQAIELAAQQGAMEIDFLRGNEPYKYSWGARDRLNYRLRSPYCCSN